MKSRTKARVPGPGACAVAGILGLGLVAGSGLPAAAAPIPPAIPTTGPGAFSESNIAADRTPSNFFYRIPALTYLGGGVVLAAWDGRPGSSADAPNPNSIVQRRSTDGGQTWGPLQVIAAGHVGDATGPKFGYSDPSYVYDSEAGKVFAFFVYSKDQGFGGSGRAAGPAVPCRHQNDSAAEVRQGRDPVEEIAGRAVCGDVGFGERRTGGRYGWRDGRGGGRMHRQTGSIQGCRRRRMSSAREHGLSCVTHI